LPALPWHRADPLGRQHGADILRALEEEGTRKRSKEVLLKAPVGIVNYLINHKREHIALIEARYGMSVRIEADPHWSRPTIRSTSSRPRRARWCLDAGLMGAPVDEDEDEDPVISGPCRGGGGRRAG
jgi:ribonuclease E